MRAICATILLLLLGVQAQDNNRFERTLGHIKPKADNKTQATTVTNLIRRLIPERADEFIVKVDPDLGNNGLDAFKLQSQDDGKILIIGTTGVAAANGFNYYLKYFCNCQVAWDAKQLNLPRKLPQVDIIKHLNDRFRYYQNVCTTSYSFVWWNWNQWENHIDWMALNAFNLVLSFHGQEAIWNRVYQKLNLTSEEIDEHFTGPAFLSWLRMGNIRGWGGPLSAAWHERSLFLQKQILQRMRDFGIIPVLPAFAGHLPRAFKRLYPDVNMVKVGTWNGFNDTYCCPYFLDPTEELFKTIGKMFIEEQIAEYGTDHVYNCDSFNEVDPLNSDLGYLANVSLSIYNAIQEADDQGIWIMQGWLFYYSSFWKHIERVKAFITSVPVGKMIILDLQSEEFPQYDRLEQYFGQPYIWCMLHNFGGTLGMFGSANIINERPIEARNANGSTMIGTGLTPEGINQNFVIYDLMTENAWRSEPTNLTTWFTNYTIRRYGFYNPQIDNSWQGFKDTVYSFAGTEKMRGQYAMTKPPSWKIATWTWYDTNQFMDSAFNLFEALDNLECEACLHDSIDFSRQITQVLCDLLYNYMLSAYKSKDIEAFNNASLTFLQLLQLTDQLLYTSKNFLLSNWVSDARNCANTTEDADLFEYNARNQITLWGPRGEIMNYANKQWAGVVGEVFYARWKLFIDYTRDCLKNNEAFNQNFIKDKMFNEVEEPFTFAKLNHQKVPKGNLTESMVRIKEVALKIWSESLLRQKRQDDERLQLKHILFDPKVLLL